MRPREHVLSHEGWSKDGDLEELAVLSRCTEQVMKSIFEHLVVWSVEHGASDGTEAREVGFLGIWGKPGDFDGEPRNAGDASVQHREELAISQFG